MTLEPNEDEGKEPRDEAEGSEETKDPAASGYTEEEEAEVAKRLEDLGYL
jgi:hypothetical protein